MNETANHGESLEIRRPINEPAASEPISENTAQGIWVLFEVACSCTWTGIEIMDLMWIGLTGLLEAHGTFDREGGGSFPEHARPLIRKAFLVWFESRMLAAKAPASSAPTFPDEMSRPQGEHNDDRSSPSSP